MKTIPALVKPLAAALFAALLVAAAPASAHCDGRDGPVVDAARDALDKGDVNRVLIWVQKDDEPAIREAFEKTRSVRKLNAASRELADDYFYETLVRVHRAGEGAPYTGLKPAGRDLGPALPAADKAVKTGSAEPLLELLTEHVRHDVHGKFEKVMATKDFDREDVAAGQRYIAAYVEFVHAVERIAPAEPAKHGH